MQSSEASSFADVYKLHSGNKSLISALKKLDGMVGCHNLKQQVARFVKYLSLSTMQRAPRVNLRKRTMKKRKISEQTFVRKQRLKLQKKYMQKQSPQNIFPCWIIKANTWKMIRNCKKRP